MILTGSEIKKEIKKENINISPFNESQINPNSYNYRLGNKLKIFKQFDGECSIFKEIKMPEKGYRLEPNQMYLGHTFETIGSQKYAMSLIGRSSVGRLGLFLQISANLGHTTSNHQWTLEMVALKPLMVYPEMMIGQVSFWSNKGSITRYCGNHGKYNKPQESLLNINNRYDSYGK